MLAVLIIEEDICEKVYGIKICQIMPYFVYLVHNLWQVHAPHIPEKLSQVCCDQVNPIGSGVRDL